MIQYFMNFQILPGNRLPSRRRPRLTQDDCSKSKNSTKLTAGSASEAPPATMIPSLPLTLALTQEC